MAEQKGRWAAVLVAAAIAVIAAAAAADEDPVVVITAEKFHFRPDRIELKRGRPVVLELRSADDIHGFRLPELGIHAELLPGQVQRIRLTPDRTGRFGFVCDHFCGIGHDEMDGEVVVTD
jgi:cytochrome c oxidase subunit 2